MEEVMLRSAYGRLVAATLVVLVGACGEEGEEAGDSARRTATSVAQRAEATTRLTTTLSGAAEVPTRGDPDGSGTASVNVDVSKGEVCYEVSVQKIDRPLGMHIHQGEAGKSGEVRVPLSTPTASDATTTGCANADQAIIGRMVATPTEFYVNVHTSTYPEGAVRGQLSRA
jgi:hypothetical protein